MKKIIIFIGFVVSFALISLGVVGLILNNRNDEIKQQLNNNDNAENKLEVLVSALNSVKKYANFTYETEVETDTPTEKSRSLMKVNMGTKESEVLISVVDNIIEHNFIVLEEGKLTSYKNIAMLDNKYTKSKATDEDVKIDYDMSYIDVFLNNIKLFKSKENNLFSAILPKNLASTININSTDNSKDIDDNQEIIGNVEVIIKLDNNNTLEKIVLNFSNSLKIRERIYTNYFITCNYYDIGSTKVIVPNDIKSSVIES